MTINKDVAGGDDGLKDKNLDTTDVVVDDTKNDDEDVKLSDVINPLLEGDDEEEVTIKRGSLKKIHEVKENYKTVAVAAKKKPKENPVVEPKKEDKKEEFVTVASVHKNNEKQAIKMATVIDSKSDDEDTQALKKEINDNWDSIKGFYTGKGGKEDPQAIYEDILDAHAAWKRRYGSREKPEDGSVAANLAHNRGMGGTGGTKPTDTKKGGILPKSGSPKDTWYPKKD